LRRDSEEAFEPTFHYAYAQALQQGWSDAGLIQTFEPLVSDERLERIRTVLEGRLGSVTLLMDAPHDPHNGAAVLRTCDALGIQRIHVVPREEAFLASRVVTPGSEQWVDALNHSSPDHARATRQAQGFTLCGTHPQGSLTPEDLRGLPKLALILGNEHDGIREALKNAADHNVRIPMRGFVESLNVSVSAAALLYAATKDRAGDLEPVERQGVYARWLLQSVARSDEILRGLRPV